jgi:hypothetical protein
MKLSIWNIKHAMLNGLHIWRYICLDFVWLSKHKFIYRSSDSISIILSPEDWMRGVPSKMMHCQKGSKGDMQRMMCVQYIRIYTHNSPTEWGGISNYWIQDEEKVFRGALGIEGTAMWDDVARMMLYQRYR